VRRDTERADKFAYWVHKTADVHATHTVRMPSTSRLPCFLLSLDSRAYCTFEREALFWAAVCTNAALKTKCFGNWHTSTVCECLKSMHNTQLTFVLTGHHGAAAREELCLSFEASCGKAKATLKQHAGQTGSTVVLELEFDANYYLRLVLEQIATRLRYVPARVPFPSAPTPSEDSAGNLWFPSRLCYADQREALLWAAVASHESLHGFCKENRADVTVGTCLSILKDPTFVLHFGPESTEKVIVTHEAAAQSALVKLLHGVGDVQLMTLRFDAASPLGLVVQQIAIELRNVPCCKPA